MGPFPHDAPAATISADNPMGTDGFEFVEYAHPKPEELRALFKLMGYAPVARHKTKKITVYRQGDINYLVNEEPGTHGHGFVAAHGPCAPSMAFRVVDAKRPTNALCRSVRRPLIFLPRRRRSTFPPSRALAAVCFIRRSLRRKGSAYDIEFEWLDMKDLRPRAQGSITSSPPITSIVGGWMCGPLRKLLNFRQIRFSTSKAGHRVCSPAH